MTGRYGATRPQPRGRPRATRTHGRGPHRTRSSSGSTATTTAPTLPGDGWHGVMNYVGFTKPLWTWLCDPDDPPKFLGLPTARPAPRRRPRGRDHARVHLAHPLDHGLTHSFNLVGSHDTTRVRTLVDDDPRLSRSRPGLLLTMPSIPMVTYGDEIGMEGDYGEDGRRPMPWDERRWDRQPVRGYRPSSRRVGSPWRCGAVGCGGSTPTRDVMVFSASPPGRPRSSTAPAPPTTRSCWTPGGYRGSPRAARCSVGRPRSAAIA